MFGCRLILALSIGASLLAVGEARAECEALPKVAWWGDVTHSKIIQHVDTRLDGDWAAYIEQWQYQQVMLNDLVESGSSAVLLNRGAAFDIEAVTDYMIQVEKRVEITRCLAMDEGFDGLDDFHVASGDDDEPSTK